MTGVPDWMTVNPGRKPAQELERARHEAWRAQQIRDGAIDKETGEFKAPDDSAAAEPAPRPPAKDYDPVDRTTFIGGSDIAAILGLSPWRTAVDVFFDKTAGERKPLDADRLKVLRRGKRLEPYVLEMLQEEHPRVLVTGRNKRYQDPDVPYFAAEVDFEWLGRFGGERTGTVDATWLVAGEELEATQPQNGEIKTVHPFRAGEWGEADSEEVPIHYAAQAMWGLGVTRRDFTIVSTLFGADNLVHYRVLRDDETIAAMRAKGQAFWVDHVLTGVPPPPQTLADLGRLWPRDSGAKVEATPEIAAALTTFFALRQRARSFKEGRDSVEIMLGEFMKDATTLTYQGATLCTRKAQGRVTVDADALKKLAPELFARVAKRSEFRIIRKPGAKTR